MTEVKLRVPPLWGPVARIIPGTPESGRSSCSSSPQAMSAIPRRALHTMDLLEAEEATLAAMTMPLKPRVDPSAESPQRLRVAGRIRTFRREHEEREGEAAQEPERSRLAPLEEPFTAELSELQASAADTARSSRSSAPSLLRGLEPDDGLGHSTPCLAEEEMSRPSSAGARSSASLKSSVSHSQCGGPSSQEAAATLLEEEAAFALRLEEVNVGENLPLSHPLESLEACHEEADALCLEEVTLQQDPPLEDLFEGATEAPCEATPRDASSSSESSEESTSDSSEGSDTESSSSSESEDESGGKSEDSRQEDPTPKNEALREVEEPARAPSKKGIQPDAWRYQELPELSATHLWRNKILGRAAASPRMDASPFTRATCQPGNQPPVDGQCQRRILSRDALSSLRVNARELAREKLRMIQQYRAEGHEIFPAKAASLPQLVPLKAGRVQEATPQRSKALKESRSLPSIAKAKFQKQLVPVSIPQQRRRFNS